MTAPVVEESLRRATLLGKRVKRRVGNDIDVAYERSKNILENWDALKLMDSIWSARETAPEKHPCATLRPYLIAGGWICILLLTYLVYYVDIEVSSSIFWYISIRLGEITFLILAILCFTCCFERGLDFVMGGILVISVFWSAPPKKRASNGRHR